MLLRIPSITRHSSNPTPHPFLKKGGWRIDLTKNPKKGGMEKLLKGRGIPIRGDSVGKWGIFSSWGVANVTNVVTFNYILVTVFLFRINVGVSPYFHCTVLVLFTGCILPVSII